MNNKVNIFLRNPNKLGNFSVEIFYSELYKVLNKHIEVNLIRVPSRSSGIVSRIFNVLFCFFKQSGAIPEILSSKYLIFKSGCSISLAKKIKDIKMLNEKSKQEIINQNYSRAFNFLTSKNQVKEIFNILKNE